MNRKQISIIVLIAFFVGALGSILISRFFIPYLAQATGWEALNNLSTNSPIVVNRTQEISLNEGINLIDLTKQTSNVIVSFYSGNQNNLKFVGNGIILSTDGLIMATSQISVPNATVLRAVLNDGRSFPATIRAADPRSPILMVTIPATDLPVAQFTESKNLQTAQRVVGVGQSSASEVHKFITGYVSRTINNNASIDKVFTTESFGETFQASMQVTADYYGGPVVNFDGRVVGMMANVADSIIPSEVMESALSSYLANGKITRQIAGIKYLNLSSSLSTLKGLNNAGALVVSTDENSAGRKSGLVANDLIVAVDNQNIDQNNSFEYLFNKRSSTMKLSVVRAGNRIEINLTPTLTP